MRKLIMALAALVLLLAGCSSNDVVLVEPAEILYKKALVAVEDKSYEDARRIGETIRQEYPFSPLAVEVELLDAEISFKQESFDAAIQSYGTFVDLHPFHEKAPYALYMKGVSNYMLMDSEDRDVTYALEAVKVLERFLKANLKSPYFADASEKQDKALNLLADHELYVARYYNRQEKFDAALNRLKGLLKDYPQSKAAKEAEILVREIETKKGG